MTPDFIPFPKMARLSREAILTEKIDGTCSTVMIIGNPGGYYDADPMVIAKGEAYQKETDSIIPAVMYSGSRTRWITPADDNYGFSKWVLEHAMELFGLGFGIHRGEWWGCGIQRNYGLKEKRFSLFNAMRWCPSDEAVGLSHMSWDDKTKTMVAHMQEPAPECCHVVPVLHRGIFYTGTVDRMIMNLVERGSRAAPGFMNPEGVVVFHLAGNVGFKKTILDDDNPKSR